jgi:Icc protein
MTAERRPRKRRNKPLRLLQFTDSHVSGDEDGRVRGVDTLASFASCLEHARRHHAPVDAILLTGDLVQDDSRGYLRLATLFSGTRAPVHCIPGNHDLPGEMADLLSRRPFSTDPVVRCDEWTLVLLDSSVEGAGHGEIGEEALGVLDDVLGRYGDTHALVVLHHHPLPTGSPWLDDIMLREPQRLLEVLGRHDNVRGLLWGHVHQAFDALQDGVAMMATPSTCFQFVPGCQRFDLDGRPPGYRWLHLYPDGRIESRVVWLDEGS